MTYKYTEWRSAFRNTSTTYSLEEAKKAHTNRELYHVLVLDDNGQEYCSLEIKDDFIYVGFIDDKKRTYLNYTFREVSPGKLFLNRAQYNVFNDFELSTTSIFAFWESGKMNILESDLINKKNRSSLDNEVDITPNYEYYPEFGDYEGLIQKERGLKI